MSSSTKRGKRPSGGKLSISSGGGAPSNDSFCSGVLAVAILVYTRIYSYCFCYCRVYLKKKKKKREDK